MQGPEGIVKTAPKKKKKLLQKLRDTEHGEAIATAVCPGDSPCANFAGFLCYVFLSSSYAYLSSSYAFLSSSYASYLLVMPSYLLIIPEKRGGAFCTHKPGFYQAVSHPASR